MIDGTVIVAGVRINLNAPVNTFALHAITQGRYGALMAYRASFPNYGLVGYYRSPGSVVRAITSDHICYAVHEDSTIRILPADLGDKAGLWGIYSDSNDPTHTMDCGAGVLESWDFGIDGVITTYSLNVMGVALAVPATTFPPPHVGSTQVPFAAAGQVVTAKHPLVQIQPAVSSGLPTGDFAVFAGSITAAGYGSAAGTIRQDSLGSAAYQILAPVATFQVRFGLSVYNQIAGGFDQSVSPMTAACDFSLTRG